MENVMREFKEMLEVCASLLNNDVSIEEQVRSMIRFLTPIFRVPSWFYDLKTDNEKYRDVLEELYRLYNKKITEYKETDLEEIAYYVNDAINQEYIYYDDGEKWKI